MAELREDLRERLTELKERDVKGELRDRALQAMLDKVEVELPDTLVDDETEHRVEHAKQQAERSGVTIEQLLEAQGWDEERLRQDSRDHAVRAINSDLVLEGIARDADIQVDADETGQGDRRSGPGLRPRSQGIGHPTRPKRTDRDAGRGYHQRQGPRPPGRTCRHHR